MKISGATTATRAASGATFSASRSQGGSGQGRDGIRKKLRVTTLTTASPAMATQT